MGVCACFNPEGDIFTLNGYSLKFTYLGSSISPTESDTNMRLMKVLIAIDWLLIIWKSDPSNKAEFLPSSAYVNSAQWIHHMGTDKMYKEKARLERHKIVTSHIEQILEATSHKTTAVRLPISYL